MKNYPNNLTNSQYDTIIRIIGNKRKRKHSLKDIFDAIRDFPKWERVYYYFQQWSSNGTLEEIHEVLRRLKLVVNVEELMAEKR